MPRPLEHEHDDIGDVVCGHHARQDILRPAAIVRDLDLKRPIYRQTAAYGHFGRSLPGFTWEAVSRLDDFRSAVGL